MFCLPLYKQLFPNRVDFSNRDSCLVYLIEGCQVSLAVAGELPRVLPQALLQLLRNLRLCHRILLVVVQQ